MDREDVELCIVDGLHQKADAFTKAVEVALWPKTLENLGVRLDLYTVKSTLSTGLKMASHVEMEGSGIRLDKQMPQQPAQHQRSTTNQLPHQQDTKA